MTVIAEFTIDSDEFILGQVLARSPNTHVEMERVVPASGKVMPYVWVHGGGFEEFEQSVRSSKYVEHLHALDTVGESALYRVEWTDDIESLVYGMAETDATILEARGNEKWFFRIRFDSHQGLTDFHNFCMEHNIVFRLERVYTLAEEHGDGHKFDLTDAQRRALLLAVRGGYFEVPRGTTLGELGGEIGISEQSVSENIRRGTNKILTSVLFDS
ncbi:helix-turn-helix domain-containing protein [Halomicroarcula limicola]|uniref:Helix-turn-helix domain-containing protein n=1 Tax=Haloarcula limicola TaxID=1429915 RepID=A0A8J7YB97_9EURY|nr:helix-turn-helix domain-containing protein [Halomicroarcula limicola]MBV0924709.1 helix-turn-helix domain-containing protein [Halomicroarcula limicola]